MSSSSRRRCRCRKRLYKDQVAVMLALAEIERKDRPQAREQRWYSCPDGKGWHLTSQPRRPKR